MSDTFRKTVCLLSATGLCLPLVGGPLPLPPPPNAPGEQQPVFGVQDGRFTFDGKPAVIISGSIHYPRVPRPYWRDRIRKARAMGFNCIGTYVFWNAHEKEPGEFDFSGNLDIAAFARICQEEGMWLIVRPGPYVCSEWDFGGLPAWLLKDPDTQVRSNDPAFLEATARYMNAVGEQLKELQIHRGGPIIQIQVENEYGQFGRPDNAEDRAYNRAIYQQLLDAGFDTMFIRCDWPRSETIDTAHIDGVYTTMNFGGSAQESFEFFEQKYPGMPKMSGEYWVGWFDHWGARHHTKELEPFIREIRWMLDNAVSFNVYMLHGGSNFGFTSGANWSSGRYSADTTSYDYDAPIDETGRITDKFYVFRETIRHYLPEDAQLPEPPPQIRRIDVPEFTLSRNAGFEQACRGSYTSAEPPYMEALDLNQGLAIYSATLTVHEAGAYPIHFSALKDRAILIVNGKRMATLDRRLKQDSTVLSLPEGESRLDILLENMGHINYSRELMNDRKGLGRVTLDGEAVLNWTVRTFPLESDDIASLRFTDQPPERSALPAFYRGEFMVDEPGDTLLDMTGWGKGMIWVNGINLGRYWSIGPQYTLYLPGCWMKNGTNEVVVMDIEPTGHRSIRGVTERIYGLNLDANLDYCRKPGETVQFSDAQQIDSGVFDPGDAAQVVDFGKTVEARYLGMETLSSHTGDDVAAIAEIHLMDAAGNRLDRDGWQVIYADSEELLAAPGSAANVIDNQPVTFWQTRCQGDQPADPHPHRLVIDLGEVKAFRSLRYLPRNGTGPGKISAYRIYASPTLFDGLQAD